MSSYYISNNDCLTKFIDLIPEPAVVIDNQEKIGDATKAQGMGFGLAICKRIVAHGGTIAVKTAKGIGKTFTVTLPIEPKVKMGGE